MSVNEKKTTICGLCGNTCAVDVRIADGRILSVEKSVAHACLNNHICVRGAALKQYIHHRDRIERPMKRVGDSFEPISWEQAISEMAARLDLTRRESGARSTVFFAGHPKWYRKVLAELAAEYGTPNFCTESSTCNSAMRMAWQLVCGGQLPPDAAHSDVHVIWTANTAGGNGDNSAVNRLRKRGVKLIVADPRVTATSDAADLHLQLLPGTDGALALGIANAILSEGLEDREFIDKYTLGFEDYRDYVRGFTPERAAEITGVPAEKIIQAARMMAGNKVSLATSSCAVVHSVNGVQNLRAVLLLLALTGNLGREGGNLTGTGPAKAELDVFHHALAQRPNPWDDLSGGSYPVWDELVGNECQCIRLADVILDEKPYPIRNLISFGMNADMWPSADRMREALRKVEYSVVTELFWNDACEAADLVLPVCASPERDQVLMGSGSRLMFVPRALDPGEKLTDIEIMLRLAHAMDLHGPLLDLKDYDAYLEHTMRLAGVTLRELRAEPEGIVARKLKQPKPFDPETDFKTPSGKVEFVSTELGMYDDLPGHAALPEFTDWRDVVGDRTDYPFTLVCGARKAHLFHSRTYRVSWLSGLEPHTVVNLCPADADALGVADGDSVRLTTPMGSLIYTVSIDSGVLPGVVHVYHDDGEQNINRLLDNCYTDPISGFPGYRSYICRLQKV